MLLLIIPGVLSPDTFTLTRYRDFIYSTFTRKSRLLIWLLRACADKHPL